jgi:hypothetical protein
MKRTLRILCVLCLTAFSFLAASALSSAPAYAAQVAVTVEKATLGEGFIVEPALVTVSEGQTVESVTTALLTARFPGVARAYKTSGTGTRFYLQGVYDPSRGGLLSEFSQGSGSGWMITVNNFFIRTSAGTHRLAGGDVIRWQYTKQLGRDLGEDANVLGTNTKADKDRLVWKVAEINAAGNRSAYGGAYTSALSLITDLSASQSSVDSALAALDSITPGSGGTTPGGTTPGGGTDTGTTPGTPGGGGTDTGTTPGTPGGGTDTGTTPGTPGTPSGGTDTGTVPGGGSDTGTSPGTPGGTTPGAGTDTGIAPSATPGAKAEIMTTTPFSPASGIEKAIGTGAAGASDLQALGYGDSVAVNADGAVTFSEEAFRNAPGAAPLMDAQKTVTPLPVFRAGVTEGKTALVTIKLTLDGYAGETLGSMAVLKMTRGGSVARLTMAQSAESMVSGSYVWTDAAGNAVSPSEKAVIGRNYYMSVAIGDGSEYDLDREPGTIVDPLALAVAGSGSGGWNDDGSGGSPSGGGCDAGAGVLSLLPLAFAVLLRRRGG